jgi:hypothetical protein
MNKIYVDYCYVKYNLLYFLGVLSSLEIAIRGHGSLERVNLLFSCVLY